jgi:hypothetical protein
MVRDADLFRAGLEISSCLTPPQEVFSRPGLAARVMELGGRNGDRRARRPSREELVELMSPARGVCTALVG